MLEGLWNIGSYIVAISILVAFHEFGHFWVARRFGVKVLRYSIGFGKPIWRRTARDGVEYQIGSIPLGGYVKLLDEREGDVAAEDLPRAFNRQPVAARIAIFAAGPVFNFILAIAFYWLLFVVGIPGMKSVVAEPPPQTAAAQAGLHAGDDLLSLDGVATPTWARLRTELLDHALAHGDVSVLVEDRQGAQRKILLDLAHVSADPEKMFDDIGLDPYEPPLPPVLGELMPGSAAGRAGLIAGDRITAVEGVPVQSFQQISKLVSERPGRSVKIDYLRGDQPGASEVLLASEKIGERTIGRLGAKSVTGDERLWQDLRAEMRLNPLAAVPAAFAETWRWTRLTLKLMHRMLIGEVSVKNVSGPIQIAQAAGFTASHGWVSFLGFIALVSISLGIFNLLPVPILDGGQILFALIEAVKGSPLSERMQIVGQQLGLTLLALLMGLAIFNDVSRSFG